MVPNSPSFYLVPTNRTLELASVGPVWGRAWPWRGMHRNGHFQQTRYTELQAAIVQGLARHPARTYSRRKASVCIVASSPRKACCTEGFRWSPQYCVQWRSICPRNRRVVVIDVSDADEMSSHLCASTWSKCLAPDDPRVVVRVTGNPPLLTPRYRCGFVSSNSTITMPYLAHARNDAVAQMSTGARTVTIALVASAFGHRAADKHGFSRWRRDLRSSCVGMHNPSLCSYMHPAITGKNAMEALKLYERSVFCLQPPGDSIARAGIIDALSVGCIPVLFHRAQAALWPWSGSGLGLGLVRAHAAPCAHELPRAR